MSGAFTARPTGTGTGTSTDRYSYMYWYREGDIPPPVHNLILSSVNQMLQDALLVAPTPALLRRQETEHAAGSLILKAAPWMRACLLVLRVVSAYLALIICMLTLSSWCNLIINLTPYGGYTHSFTVSFARAFFSPVLALLGACLLSANVTFARDCAHGDYLPLLRTAMLPDMMLRPCANLVNWWHHHRATTRLERAVPRWRYKMAVSPYLDTDKPCCATYVMNECGQMVLDWLVLIALHGVPLIGAMIPGSSPFPQGYHNHAGHWNSLDTGFTGRLCAWWLLMHQLASLIVLLFTMVALGVELVSAACHAPARSPTPVLLPRLNASRRWHNRPDPPHPSLLPCPPRPHRCTRGGSG